MSTPPNIVVVMADQLAATMVGFGGAAVDPTPNLDRLAGRSLVFDRAYVANPVCMPSRATIITGRYPSSHGARVNGVALRPDQNTFVRSLRAAGYRTGLVGKSHIQSHGDGAAVARGMWPSGLDGDASIDNRSWDSVERRSAVRDSTEIADYYGFDHVEFTIGHGDDIGGHHAVWAAARGADLDRLGGERNALPYAVSGEENPIPMHLWRTNVPEELHATTFVAERSAAFIHAAVDSRRPFFLQCSFPDPHHPFGPPGSWFDLYDADELDLPATFDDAHNTSMPHIREIASRRGQPAGPYGAFAPAAVQWRAMAARAYGSLRFLDVAVGKVLAQLDASGVTDNTIVVVCADHGEMFGDHGLMLKSAMHYDNVVRVPFAIAGPEVHTGRTDALVSLVDVAPTMLDLAGVAPYWGMQGTSLGPLLDGSSDSVRDAILIEEDLDLYGRPFGLRRLRTLVTHDARLTLSEGGGGELFDFGVDPGETVNLFDDPASVVLRAEMRDRLLDTMIELADRSPLPAQFA